jgi:hypothetical protein
MQTTRRNDQPKPILPPDLQQALRDAVNWPEESRIERINRLTAEAVARGYCWAPIDTSRLHELRVQCGKYAKRADA